VEIRPVKASSWQEREWIIESGVRPGDRIIVEGFHKLAPGAPVRPVSAEQAAEGATVNGTAGGAGQPGGSGTAK
jgi:membrane fusion protein, multidrug efflux system